MGYIIGMAAFAAWLTHVVTCLAAGAARSAAEERRRAENTDDPDDTMLWGVDLS